MNILIAGSSGLIGTALKEKLKEKYNVYALCRDPSKNSEFYWNPSKEEFKWNEEINIDVVINLCGENIAKKRWNKNFKKRIFESRVNATKILAKKISNLKYKPNLFISSSAIGYYGDNINKMVHENNPPGNDFLSKLSIDWENATHLAENMGIRTVHLRTGIVLSPNGGALKQMLPAFKLGLGSIFGEGNQFMSWISLNDAVNAIIFLMEKNNINGAVNLVSPKPETNLNFSKMLGKSVNRTVLFKLPKWLAKLIFGEMAEPLFYSNIKVEPRTLKVNKFEYENSDLQETLKNFFCKKN